MWYMKVLENGLPSSHNDWKGIDRKYKYKKMNKYAVGSNRLIDWIFPKYESFHLLMISLI